MTEVKRRNNGGCKSSCVVNLASPPSPPPRHFAGSLASRYFEERFGIDSGSLGYISSYTACLSFAVQVRNSGTASAVRSAVLLLSR